MGYNKKILVIPAEDADVEGDYSEVVKAVNCIAVSGERSEGDVPVVQSDLSIAFGSAGTGDTSALEAEITRLANVQNMLSASNIILNGEFAIDQDGNTSGIVLGSTPAYITDGIKANLSGVTGTITAKRNLNAIAPPPGFDNYIGVEATTDLSLGSATSYAQVLQSVEGLRASTLGWHGSNRKDAFLGFWFRATKTGFYTAAIRDSAYATSFAFSFGIIAADTWQLIPIPIPAPSIGTWPGTNAAAMHLGFTPCAGTDKLTVNAETWQSAEYLGVAGSALLTTAGDTIYFTGIDMYPIDDVANPVVRPYQHKGYDDELRECQTYHYEEVRSSAVFTAGHCCYSATSTIMSIPVPKMRTSPAFSTTGSFSLAGQGGASVTGVTLNNYANGTANLNIAGTGFTTGGYCGLAATGGTSKLIFDCRL